MKAFSLRIVIGALVLLGALVAAQGGKSASWGPAQRTDRAAGAQLDKRQAGKGMGGGGGGGQGDNPLTQTKLQTIKGYTPPPMRTPPPNPPKKGKVLSASEIPGYQQAINLANQAESVHGNAMPIMLALAVFTAFSALLL